MSSYNTLIPMSSELRGMYHLTIDSYTGLGGFCLGYAIMLMTGNAEPIPLN